VEIQAGAPASFVNSKTAEDRPETVADTVYGPPDTLFAVAVTLATPDTSVIVVGADNTAEAPLAGALKATGMPAIGFPDVSVTTAFKAAANGAPATAVEESRRSPSHERQRLENS